MHHEMSDATLGLLLMAAVAFIAFSWLTIMAGVAP